MDLRQEMTPKQKQGFDRQRARRQELLDRQTLELAESRVNLQRDGIPINNPDPVQRGTFIQARTHRRATARGFTGNELAARRQRQEARQQAENIRIRVNKERYSQLQQTPESQDLFNDTQLTTISVVRAITPPP